MADKKNEEHLTIFVKLWHQMDAIIHKAGYLRTISTALMVVFFAVCGYLVLNPEKIFDAFSKWQDKRHHEMIEKRLRQNPVIEGILSKLLVEAHAHRCWVIEAHNGKENVTGMPFVYGNMSYQVCEDSIFNSTQDWVDFQLDRFPMVTKLIKEGYWSGTTKELYEIDKALARKIIVNETKSLCIVTLYGCNSAIGWLGVSFTHDEGFNEEKVEGLVRRYSYQIAANIDANKVE